MPAALPLVIAFGVVAMHVLIAVLYAVTLWLSLAAYLLIIDGPWQVCAAGGPVAHFRRRGGAARIGRSPVGSAMAMAQPWHLSIVALDALTITKPGHHRAFFLPARRTHRAEMIASHRAWAADPLPGVASGLWPGTPGRNAGAPVVMARLRHDRKKETCR